MTENNEKNESGYKYITPDIMYSGMYTVFNSEMYEEGERYNQEICLSRIRKRRLYELIIGYYAANVIFIGIALFMAAVLLKADQMELFVLLIVGCAAFVFYSFIQIKNKKLNIAVNVFFPVILCIGSKGFLAMTVFNAVFSTIIVKYWETLKQRDGYPYFVMLVIDSKESVEDEDGTQKSVTEDVYKFQKSGQTADLEEISVPEIVIPESVKDE